MTERDFFRAVMKKNMPDEEQVRRNCLEQDSMQNEKLSGVSGQIYGRISHWRRKLATVAVAVVVAASAGTGICYAATGEGPVAWFQALFEGSDEQAVAQVEEGFVEANEVRRIDNLELTLNRYFYDKEQGIILAEMTVKTTDGSPVTSMEDTGLFFWWPLENLSYDWSEKMEDESTLYLYEICREEAFNGTPEEVAEDPILRIENADGDIGAEIAIKPTGTLRTRDMEAAGLNGCEEIVLNGAFLQIQYEKEAYETLIRESDAYIPYPFETVQITMDDGYCYLWENNTWVFDQEDGTERVLTEEQVRRLEDESDVKRLFDTTSRHDDTGNNITTIDFPEFINVDDISSVTIDGVECLK